MAAAAKSILRLFENNKHCDVTFKVKCGHSWSSFPAHKVVLSFWSPVLANIFQQKNIFNDEIEILDILPSTFYAFINYLYDSTEKLEESKKDIKFVLNVYEAASKYQVQRLKTDCCEILNSSSPNKNNVFELIDAAVLIDSNSLKEQCFRVLQFETESILNSQDVEYFTPSMVITLLQQPSLWLSSEYELLTWVFKWAKSYCSLQNVNDPREFISPFLTLLDFTALKSKEFAILVDNHREFFDEVECFNTFMKINISESAITSLRSYVKPIENEHSGLSDDFSQQLLFTINNSTSDTSNCNSFSTVSTSPTTEESITTLDVDTVTIVDDSSDNCSTSTINICNTTLRQTADRETMTEVAMEINNEVLILSNDTSTVVSGSVNCNATLRQTADKETMTEIAMKINNEVSILPNDTSTVVDDSVNCNTTLQQAADKETMTAVPMDINNDNLSVPLETENSSVIEMAERGQRNAPVLGTIDTEPGISWEYLKPPLHLEKIKKKKIVKLYLLPEGKSLPNIGIWDSTLESSFKSGDVKSLSDIIEKQQYYRRASLK